jgi:hypothetical protein
MKKRALASATTERLVGLFVELCLEQDEQQERGDVREVNRLFDEIEAIKQELKTRPGDQRGRLMQLYKHENMQVRLKAANATLAVAPHAARATLEAIYASGWLPQSADAASMLRNLDEGIFKPT